jgi:hypothetical protein
MDAVEGEPLPPLYNKSAEAARFPCKELPHLDSLNTSGLKFASLSASLSLPLGSVSVWSKSWYSLAPLIP